MTGWLAEAALGGIFALGAWLAWDLARANLRHGHHERPADPPPGQLEDAWAVGSMDLTVDKALHHELPLPWDRGPDFIDTFTQGIAERYGLAPWERPEGTFWPAPPPSEAEVAASRAAHGYIPELDPGPGDEFYRKHWWLDRPEPAVLDDPGPQAPAGAPGPDQDPAADWEACRSLAYVQWTTATATRIESAAT